MAFHTDRRARALALAAFMAVVCADIDAGRPQDPAQTPAAEPTIRVPPPDPTIVALVGRLSLEHYKATIKGLTQFGDRRQGTKRNRDAVDWIEAQLKSAGCTNTERLDYVYTTPPRRGGPGAGAATGASTTPPPAGRGASTTQGQPVRSGPGGSTEFGFRGPTGVYQPTATDAPALDPTLASRNAEPAVDGPRQEVYCTKIGRLHPNEMFIVGGHMDGHGWGEAANDDGSGAALVMELARVFSGRDVQTDRSIRFILWNNEETGLNGSRAYVDQRQDRQGTEDPRGSGRYPEPKWLGMIQHDMMLWDHGMPVLQLNADGSPKLDPRGRPVYLAPATQRPEADVNIEFQSVSKMAVESERLAWALKAANDRYATDYPAQVGPHMTNTDSGPFQDLVPAVSLREAERGRDIQAGWDPNWHQPSDLYVTYSDKDFRLGLNAAQTTLAAVALLAGATMVPAHGH